ncbi:MAG: ATP-binding protein [Proteobacteria bacterium]|nr:ATP-binding protein [Pseudomonadota bacterium]
MKWQAASQIPYRLHNRLTRTLNWRARVHMGETTQPDLLRRTFPPYLAKDISIACKAFFESLGGEFVRFSGNPLQLFDDKQPVEYHPEASPLFQQIAVDNGSTRQGLLQGLVLFTFEQNPMMASCWQCESEYHISVIAADVAHADRFLEAFSSYEESHRTVTSELSANVERSLNSRIRAHFGDGFDPYVLRQSFPEYQIANIAILAKAFFDGFGAEFTGIGASRFDLSMGEEFDLLTLLKPAKISEDGSFEGREQAPPSFEQIPVVATSSRLGLREGIALFRYQDEPMFAYCQHVERFEPRYDLSIVSRNVEHAHQLLDAFMQYEREHSIFRGRLLRPKIDYQDRVKEAEILELTDTDWDHVVLPAGLRERLQRDVLDYIRCADALIANGIELKRGILFHGPPGTGKTFVCNLLASELDGFTSVLVAGDSLRHPEGAFRLARKLAPALLFFEDIDLIAIERQFNPLQAVLGSLLNELDGLPKSEQVYVVFTTNKLEVLEEALAQRPGRVDLVLKFPLPEPELRRRLVKLYTGKAHIDGPDVEWIVDKTKGVTPAFLRELMKQAVFHAIQDGNTDNKRVATLNRDHLSTAFAKLKGHEENHRVEKILGFRT